MKMQVLASGKTVDLSQLCTSVEWSGSVSEAARRLSFGTLVSPTDKNVPQVNIACGNTIKATEEGTELFSGYVFTRGKSYSGTEMNHTAFDGLIYVLKSKGTYNIKKMTAEGMTEKLCLELGVPIGNLAKTGILLSQIFDSKSIYEIIAALYLGASKLNGKKYKILMKQGKLNVIEYGLEVITLNHLFDSTFSETIENMVSRVKIYDDQHKLIGMVEDQALIKLYGIIQEAYVKEKDKNSAAVAKSMINGIEQSASIEVPGDVRCITGAAVKIKEPYTG